MQTKKANLIEGNIVKELTKLALPIMGTSFVQMTYNLMDMFWLGKIGSDEVAAVGTAGFFIWLAMAFILIPKIGAEVGVAQSTGAEDMAEARKYVNHTLQMDLFLAVIYAVILFFMRFKLIGFFNLGDQVVIKMAVDYLMVISFGIIFFFINPVLTGIMNGFGNSKTPFIINTVGLVVNMVLDPLFIFGIGPFPVLGVKGAALATIFAQFVLTILFIYIIRYKDDLKTLFRELNLMIKPDTFYLKRIIRLGIPVAAQEGLFAIFAMFIARIIAQWGPVAIAVQKVGAQIESLSWRTAAGFSTALTAFVGQNYGAKKWKRVFTGYFNTLIIMSGIGIAVTFLFYFCGGNIFSIFISEAEAVQMGSDYLKIMAYSQLFMMVEIATAGAFNGLGKTLPPAIVGIVFNAFRIPAALILSGNLELGIDGVWWSISISSNLKGIVLGGLFLLFTYSHPAVRAWREEERLEDKGV